MKKTRNVEVQATVCIIHMISGGVCTNGRDNYIWNGTYFQEKEPPYLPLCHFDGLEIADEL